VGAFVYYDIGAYGHVGFEVDSGDSMGSSRVQIVWGINAGVSSIEAYVAATGATPLGWSWRNGANTLEYLSSTPGGPGTPTGTTNGEIMRYKATSASKDGLIRDNDSFVQGAEGPLRLIGADEANAYEYNDQHGRPTPYAEWSGQALRDLVKIAGLRAYDGNGRPTGKITY
jgi:hypothetical protein